MKPQRKRVNSVNKAESSVNLSYIISVLLLFAYGFVTVLTPNLQSFDSNGPKFLSLSILNVLVALILFGYKDFREDKQKLFGFFTNRMGMAYTLMMLMAVLSFTKAINVGEAILHFSKILTGFTAAWFVSVLVYTNKKTIMPLAVVLTGVLILDSFQTFEGVSDIIKDKIGILEVKGSYSNKNILTSAMFIKLPFALWLFFFFKGWKKMFGLVGLFLGTLAIFFMNSRAFYLATAITFVMVLIYSIIYYKKNEKSEFLLKSVYYFITLVVTFGIFLFVHYNMYPKSRQTNLTGRIQSITNTTTNTSNTQRLDAWKWSVQMIKKDPLLGVGVGNWKIRVLEYENKKNSKFIYMYKNHNDFLEIPAELGILAGLAFISIFLFMGWYLIMALFKRKDREEQQFFFLPAFGLFAYSFDAFFNFPQDRPEIQSLFAIHVGVGVGLALLYYGKERVFEKIQLGDLSKKIIYKLTMGTTVLALCGGTYVLNMYFKSLKIQRKAREESKGIRKTKTSADKIISEFPPIPNQTAVLESVELKKASYLFDEKRYEEARKYLLNDNSSPWDGRREYYLALSYYFPEKKNLDSVQYYMEKSREVKPLFFESSNMISYVLLQKGKMDEAIKVWEEYIGKLKTEARAWETLSLIYERKGNTEEAFKVLDSAIVYLPNNEKIISKRKKLEQKIGMGEFKTIYNSALQYYRKKDYQKATEIFSQFLDKVPNYEDAYKFRSVCYYHLGEYKKALKDLELQQQNGTSSLSPSSINIKASCYYMLGDKDNAKKFFKQAKDAGNKDAISNYKKLFGEDKQEKTEVIKLGTSTPIQLPKKENEEETINNIFEKAKK